MPCDEYCIDLDFKMILRSKCLKIGFKRPRMELTPKSVATHAWARFFNFLTLSNCHVLKLLECKSLNFKLFWRLGVKKEP